MNKDQRQAAIRDYNDALMGIKDENYVIAPVKVAEAKEPEKIL